MISKAITWFYFRFRPEDGWLPVLLMGVITLLVAYQVTITRWVPEGSIAWLAVISLFLVLLLNHRRLGWLPAWLLLVGYGLVLTTIWLGRLWPPLRVIFDGWGAISQFIRQNFFLFADRVAGWLEAVASGGSSHETIVFAFGLGLLAWLVVAFAAWITFRQRRPLIGVLVIGLALAMNGFYGQAPLPTLAIFIGLAVLLVAVVHLSTLQQRWESNGIDYSTEIRLDLLVSGAAIAMMLMALAMLVPEVNFRAMYRAVFDRPAVHQVEDSLDRAFAGVQSASGAGAGIGPGGATSGGRLPRSFLLGDAPELYETVVMTATVAGDPAGGTHWRGVSYDIYTGLGWAISAERQQPIPAGEAIPLPEYRSQSQISQVINRVQSGVSIRYSLGQPRQFDQDVESYWRGLTDLSRITGQENPYTVLSQVVAAGPDQLRQAALADVPPEILARYTTLPDSTPERVHELAREIAAGPETRTGTGTSAYDTVKRIELFLRQYPYSLEVELPPAGADPVDFFLFEQQAGYCDYYASAMVVLARSLSLPARLATGYLAQPMDQAGRQTIYQINAHSWAEVYFAGYGWVEFEPTAGFSTLFSAIDTTVTASPEGGVSADYAPPPIPERRQTWWLLLWLLLPIVLIVGGWYLWRQWRKKRAGQDETQWVYRQLQRGARRLGQATPASQTPQEFERALLQRLDDMEGQSLAGRLEPSRLRSEIRQMTGAFASRQYSQDKIAPGSPAQNWRRMRRRYWLLGQLNRLTRRWSRNE